MEGLEAGCLRLSAGVCGVCWGVRCLLGGQVLVSHGCHSSVPRTLPEVD